MGLLKHLLGGTACGTSGRSGGGRRHLESCPSCHARQARERQYLERLRKAAVPQASDDLTARLLARTEQLAAELPGTAPQPLSSSPQGPGWHRLRLPAVVAAGAAAAVALMAGAAYLMGGPPAPPPGGTGAAAFLRDNAAGPAVAGEPGRDPAAAGMAWTLTGAPHIPPAGTLNAEQLSALRMEGWACPELRDFGFHLIWARGAAAAGGEVLELRFTDGRHFVTVFEQHGPVFPAQRTAGQPPSAPVNVLTGRPASADGFTAAGSSGTAGSPGPGSGTLWINAAAPFRAIYQTSGATFTYVADLPAEQADDAVAALVEAGGGVPDGSAAPGGVPERVERGLVRILGFLAP